MLEISISVLINIRERLNVEEVFSAVKLGKLARYVPVRNWHLQVTREAAAHSCFSKYVFLENSQYSQENICVGIFLIKLHDFRFSGLQLYWKETPTKVFYCECFEIFKNSFF